MKTPFFSLITPVYNIERLLEKTIQSALEQSFADWEMILVDDGSPDDAGKICDRYAKKDSRISVIHKENEGLAEARNTGIKACTGQYFIILEGSDLLFDRETLENIYKTLHHEDVDIYFGRLQDVIEKDWKVTNVQAEYCVEGLYTKGGRKLFVELFDNADVLALSSPVNKVIRTNFVKENELWFYKGIYHDDDEWIPRAISMSKKTYFTNDIIYNALTWDGCLGLAVSDKSLARKACDKMLLAEHCCREIDRLFLEEKDTEFKRKFYEYYVRIYLAGVSMLNQIRDRECMLNVKKSIEKHKVLFDYARHTTSGNLHLLSYVKKVLGVSIATKLVLKRYS